MAEVKWIKLNTDMFNNSKIKYIRKMPGGDAIILLWVMLLTKAGKCNSHGYIMLTENMPYDAEMLAVEFEMELNTVKVALGMFQKLNMIDLDNERIVIAGWSEHQSLEKMEKVKEQNRLRKQKERERKKPLLPPKNIVTRDSHALVTQNHATDKDKDLEIDIEIDIEQQQYKNVLKEFNQKDFEAIYKYIKKNNVDVVVVVEKLNIVNSYDSVTNKVGSLIAAIRDDWKESVYKNTTPGKKLNFNNFEGRDYDHDEIERKLLGWEE